MSDFCAHCGQDFGSEYGLTRAIGERDAWKNWMREHLIGFYTQRATKGEIPLAQVKLMTDTDMTRMEGFIHQFFK